MKTINVTFEDDEIQYLYQLKKKQSWRAFILDQSNYKEVNKDEDN